MRKFTSLLAIATLLGSIIILSACGSTQSTADLVATAVSEQQQQQQSQTQSPAAAEPPASPTPQVAAGTEVWFVKGSTLAADNSAALLQTVQDLAQKSNLTVVEKEALSKDELASSGGKARLVVVLPPDPGGLADMISANAATLFITIGIPNLPSSANLYAVAPGGLHPEWEGYVAGYIAAVLTDDWRIGMLGQAGSADSASAETGFNNGGVMYCGLCNPQFPPYTDYPFIQEINPGAQSNWQPVVDAFLLKQINTAYVYPGASSPELLQYLAQNKVRLITSTEPISGLEASWIGVVKSDIATPLSTAFTDAAAGTPPGSYEVKVKITPVDTSLLTEGKMNWLNEMLDKLSSDALMQ
jgi:hypothetical protein